MQLFILFIIAAVVLGAGAMFAPAWPTSQPRIGLAAAFALALIVGGSVFWAELFGWDTLVIDYLLFALVSFVVLGGTLSSAQARAEAKGEELSDAEQGWPGPQDLAFFALVAFLAMLPLLILTLPPGNDAAGTALLTLTARLGSSFDTLAPLLPDVTVWHSPGLHGIAAYLSAQLGQPVPLIHFALSAVSVILITWLAYDIGGEIHSKPLGRAAALALLSSLGMLGLYLNGFHTQMLALVFALAFVLYGLRALRDGLPGDVVVGGLMLGATLYTDGRLFAVVLFGTLPLLATAWLVRDADTQNAGIGWQMTPSHWLKVVIGVPLVALIGTAPWLLNHLDLLGQVAQPLPAPGLDRLPQAINAHGIWLWALALWGGWIGLQGRFAGTRGITVWMIGWWIVAFDMGVTGILPGLLPFVAAYADPNTALRAGLLVPLVILGGMGLLDLFERLPLIWRGRLRAWAMPGLGAIGVGLALVVVAGQPLLRGAYDQQLLSPPDTTAADIAALDWVRQNAPEDARLLNHPAVGLWAAPLGERQVVYYPPVLAALAPVRDADADSLRPFWDNPDTFDEADLRAAGITHIVVPEAYSAQWNADTLPYAERVFLQDDASVYALPSPEDASD